MKKIINPSKTDWKSILQRPTQTVADIEDKVLAIFDDVKNNGNAAIKQYTLKFDGVELDDLFVSEEEVVEVEKAISTELKEAISIAKNNITAFHAAQKRKK